jgi:hypothetical protein
MPLVQGDVREFVTEDLEPEVLIAAGEPAGQPHDASLREGAAGAPA